MFAFNQKVYIIYMQYIDPNVVVQLTGDEIWKLWGKNQNECRRRKECVFTRRIVQILAQSYGI